MHLLWSYGGMIVILSFLNPHESLKLQALNKWCYTTAIGRVLTTFSLVAAKQHRLYFVLPSADFIYKVTRGGPVSIVSYKQVFQVTGKVWRTVQLGSHDLFQHKVADRACRLLRNPQKSHGILLNMKHFSVESKSVKYYAMEGNSLCATRDGRYVYACSGYGWEERRLLHDVERYDSEGDRWEVMPKLNIARLWHSSCVLGDQLVFVICGAMSKFNPSMVTGTVECLDTRQLDSGWVKLDWLDRKILTKRSMVVATQIGKD